MGRWKNYDDLEESMCFEELIATVNAMREKEMRDRRFLAALQGIDLDEEVGSSKNAPQHQDITTLSGAAAAQEGFGIGMGLGHVTLGDDE